MSTATPPRRSSCTSRRRGCRCWYADPGCRAGVVRHHVVGLHDLAPTLLAQTRAEAPRRFTIDGRNLVPLMRDGSGTATGRDLLIESLDKDSSWRSYDAIRTTSGYVYVEYAGRGVELYNLAKDPSQINNLAGRPAARRPAAPAGRAALAGARLRRPGLSLTDRPCGCGSGTGQGRHAPCD